MTVHTITLTAGESRKLANEIFPVARLGHYLKLDGRMLNSLPIACEWCPARFRFDSLLNKVWLNARRSEARHASPLHRWCDAENARLSGFDTHLDMNDRSPAVLGDNQYVSGS